jgi:hypothetical protein
MRYLQYPKHGVIVSRRIALSWEDRTFSARNSLVLLAQLNRSSQPQTLLIGNQCLKDLCGLAYEWGLGRRAKRATQD